MTLEILAPTPPYTVSGTGPYAITHPYAADDDLLVTVRQAGVAVTLVLGEHYTVSPTTSFVAGGSLTLTAGAATDRDGWTLEIVRATPLEQGWQGIAGPREKGLERQLDRTVMAAQDRGAIDDRALVLPIGSTFSRTLVPGGPGHTIIVNPAGTAFVEGPAAAEIAGAAASAAAAAASASAAAASAAEAASSADYGIGRNIGRDMPNDNADDITLGGIYAYKTTSVGGVPGLPAFAAPVLHLPRQSGEDVAWGQLLHRLNEDRLFARSRTVTGTTLPWRELARGLPAAPIGLPLTIAVPADYPTLAAAFAAITPCRHLYPHIDIVIETGHQITAGLRIDGGDWSNVRILYEADAGVPGTVAVALAGGFVGVDNSDLPGGASSVFDSTKNLFVFADCLMPVLACRIDMNSPRGASRLGNGIYAQASRLHIEDGCGVINAGVCGLYAQGVRLYALASVWDGAGDACLRIQQASNVTFQDVQCAGGCADTGLAAGGTAAAVFLSRGSVGHFTGASITGSLRNGIETHRAFLSMTEAVVTDNANDNCDFSHGSHVVAKDCDLSDAGRHCVRVAGGSFVSLHASTLTGHPGGSALALEAGGGVVMAEDVTTFTGTPGVPRLADVAGVPAFNFASAKGVIFANVPGPAETFGLLNAGAFSGTGASNGRSIDANAIMQSSRSSAAAVTHQQFYNPNGLVGSIATSGTATAYNTSSDASLKELGEAVADALAAIRGVPVRMGRFKAEAPGQERPMMTGQDLLAVAPDAVTRDPESGLLQVDYSKLVPRLWAAVEALAARLEAMEARA